MVLAYLTEPPVFRGDPDVPVCAVCSTDSGVSAETKLCEKHECEQCRGPAHSYATKIEAQRRCGFGCFAHQCDCGRWVTARKGILGEY